MSMNIYAVPGTRIRYTGASDAQVHYGGHTDPRDVLTIGEIYTVHHTDVHNYSTDVFLVGHRGIFNSVCFDDVESGIPNGVTLTPQAEPIEGKWYWVKVREDTGYWPALWTNEGWYIPLRGIYAAIHVVEYEPIPGPTMGSPTEQEDP